MSRANAEGEKGATLATNLASYLRDSVKLSFKPGAFHVDQIYDAAQMLDRYDALLTQRINYVQRPRQIDRTQFTAQELAWIDEAEKLNEVSK